VSKGWAASLPKTPTELAGDAGLQVRPWNIGWTGDGTAFLGGFTGANAVKRPSRADLAWAGRLRWTSYSASGGHATGADWLNNGIPNDGRGTFRPVRVSVRVYRPRSGVFTRLSLTEQGKTLTLDATRYREEGITHWEW
jgi:hypothetical protein